MSKGKRTMGGMEDALVYQQPTDAAHQGVRVAKRKRKTQGLEVSFDAKARKEYLTGFSKRKLQRRKEALRQVAKKQREQRTLDKAERRAKLRETLQLDRYLPSASNAEGDDGDEEDDTPHADVFKSAQYTTVVTTQPLAQDSDASASQSQQEGDSNTAQDAQETAGSHLAAAQATIRKQQEQRHAAEAQRVARQAARREEKKLMMQLKAKKAAGKKKKKKKKQGGGRRR